MERTDFTATTGHLPVIETLPTLFQKPITKLQRLTCVAGLTSGKQQEDQSTSVLIFFSAFMPMDYNKALGCFIDTGLSVRSLIINFTKRYILIKLSPTKTLLN